MVISANFFLNFSSFWFHNIIHKRKVVNLFNLSVTNVLATVKFVTIITKGLEKSSIISFFLTKNNDEDDYINVIYCFE